MVFFFMADSVHMNLPVLLTLELTHGQAYTRWRVRIQPRSLQLSRVYFAVPLCMS